MKTILKWAGGKRQILPLILEYIGKHLDNEHRFYEPFVGGGIVFMSMNREKCVINDINLELMNTYEVIRDQPKDLIEKLNEHNGNHCKAYYYAIRELDRLEPTYAALSNVEKAARMIYLNRTCFNGLYRVNNQGYFNTPMGKYVSPKIVDSDTILKVSEQLNRIKPIIRTGNFVDSVSDAEPGDFVYFDPPYDYPMNDGHTRYSSQGFNYIDLQLLKSTTDALIDKGCHVLISNNLTARVLSLFQTECVANSHTRRYDTTIIKVQRYIGANRNARSVVEEVLIHGYKDPYVPSSELH